MRTRELRRWMAAPCGAAVLAACVAAMFAPRAQGQVFGPPLLVESFENPTGIGNVIIPGGTPNALYVSHSQSTVGVTNGANSLEVEMFGGGNPFSGDSTFASASIQIDTTLGNNPTGYASWAEAAANPDFYNVEFDFTVPAGGWAGTDFGDAGTHWSFPVFGLSYDDGTPGGGGATGFGQVQLGTNFYNVTGTNKVSIPLSSLTGGIPLPTNSNYYAFQFGANQRFMSPTPTTGVKYYIDRLRLTPVPVVSPVTLFSWETPDDAGTPTVNEALEGWEGTIGLNQPTATGLGDRYAHTNSVTDYALTNPALQTVFPTQGTHSLKIDTTSQDPAYVHPDNTTGFTQDYGFRWGTNMILDSTLDEDPAMTPQEAANQAKITNIASKLAGASAIQFDLALSDPISDTDPDGLGIFQGGGTAGVPGFLSVVLHISDNRGTFFQFDSPGLDGATMNQLILNERNPDGTPPDEPLTITMPLSAFTDRSGGLGTLAANPVPLDSDFLRMGLALNFNNGPVVAHIDNFRVLTIFPLDGDFDHDGDVDGADLPLWRAAYGQTDAGDADLDGDSDGNDFLLWQRTLGNDATPAVGAGGAVPEPAGAALVACGLLAGVAARRRR